MMTDRLPEIIVVGIIFLNFFSYARCDEKEFLHVVESIIYQEARD
jgi:hypothetical protein